MINFEDFSNKMENSSQIKNLDELSATMKYVASEWLKITNINE